MASVGQEEEISTWSLGRKFAYQAVCIFLWPLLAGALIEDWRNQ